MSAGLSRSLLYYHQQLAFSDFVKPKICQAESTQFDLSRTLDIVMVPAIIAVIKI